MFLSIVFKVLHLQTDCFSMRPNTFLMLKADRGQGLMNICERLEIQNRNAKAANLCLYTIFLVSTDIS